MFHFELNMVQCGIAAFLEPNNTTECLLYLNFKVWMKENISDRQLFCDMG